MQIADRGVPSNVAAQTATVQVNVFRNQFTPQFVNVPYATTVQENTGVSQSIFRVTATDADQVVSNKTLFSLFCLFVRTPKRALRTEKDGIRKKKRHLCFERCQ